jgi:hypothetical protein
MKDEDQKLMIAQRQAIDMDAILAQESKSLENERRLSAAHAATIKAHNLAKAQAAVEAAVDRGAIPAQDTQLKARWLDRISEDPDSVDLLNACQGNPIITVGRITKPVGK